MFFKPRANDISRAEFEAYFSENPLYELEFPQAWYNNGDTGVYFVFEWQEAEGEEEDELGEYPIAFNINFFRPSFFVYEAEKEVTRFVQRFGLLVSDPQVHGMGEGEYEPEKLISGWAHGNEFGYKAVLSDPKNREGIVGFPTQVLEDSWRWNFERTHIQDNFGDSVFVPRIMYLLLDGIAVTAAVWPDGIPIVIPNVDYFFIDRKELAPRRFFRRLEEPTLARYSDVAEVLDEYGERHDGGLFVLNYERPPDKVRAFIKQLPMIRADVHGIASDSALNRELIEKNVT